MLNTRRVLSGERPGVTPEATCMSIVEQFCQCRCGYGRDGASDEDAVLGHAYPTGVKEGGGRGGAGGTLIVSILEYLTNATAFTGSKFLKERRAITCDSLPSSKRVPNI
ncbi:hypothetical protein CERSUDRAFT_85478 [Gelatoporia subvermispora B]|uniref:Uncharacterized protein n=1 Tax=Ceriporiopsis subvermispora (strain B) TaxID=914234 RepID=M2RAS0_CERS8|nr:hypothetical protein CERSUDRAFT_85478 [Gelatoporia subvermispora B]